MKKTEFTKGNWEAQDGGYDVAVTCKGQDVAVVCEYGTPGEARANGLLMAQAPKMYRLLGRLKRQKVMCADDLEDIKKILKKARGK